MTVIEIRPCRNGWQVYESPGVQPMFLAQEQAFDYALAARAFALARFALWIQLARSRASRRDKGSEGLIRVFAAHVQKNVAFAGLVNPIDSVCYCCCFPDVSI
jgi:hypothetical protein